MYLCGVLLLQFFLLASCWKSSFACFSFLLLFEKLVLMSSAACNFSFSSAHTSSFPGLLPTGVSLSLHFLFSEVSTWVFCFSLPCFEMSGQVIWQCCSPDTIVLKKIILRLYIHLMVSQSFNLLVVTLKVHFVVFNTIGLPAGDAWM